MAAVAGEKKGAAVSGAWVGRRGADVRVRIGWQKGCGRPCPHRSAMQDRPRRT
jgi:hypothetical protein